jgi:RNA polymerase sigma factor (sigma-70 family)
LWLINKNLDVEALRINDYRVSQLTDAAVVQRVLAGEKELFEILLRRYNQTLYRVVRSYLRNQDEVQDAMQNAYLKAFDKLFQYQGNSSFSTWLIRIGINEALLRLNALKKQNVVLLHSRDVEIESINQVADKQMNPERQMVSHEAKLILEKAIDRLPEKYRVIYVLKEIEGLSTEQICETLSLTDSNVKVRLHRAKSLLKDLLLKLSSTNEVFEFGNSRCDAVVSFVMKNI